MQSDINADSNPQQIWWKQNIQKIGFLKIKDEKTLQEHVRKGIPNKLRSLVWPLLIDYQGVKFADFTDSKRTILRQQNREDLQLKLKNVLNALACCFPDIGYNSGFNFVMSIPILYCTQQQTFKIGYHLIQHKNHKELVNRAQFILKHVYVLNIILQQLPELIKMHLPHLYQILQKNQVDPLYFSSWILTLFINVFPLKYSIRIFQCYLLEGRKLIYRIAIQFLKIKSKGLDKIQDPTQILFFLTTNNTIENILTQEYLEKFLKDAFEISIKTEQLEQIQRQYAKQNSKKQAQNQIKQ